MGKAWQHGQSPVHWVRRREGRGMRSEPEHLVAQGREAPAPRRFPSPPPPCNDASKLNSHATYFVKLSLACFQRGLVVPFPLYSVVTVSIMVFLDYELI